ncbi:MAG: VanW family protein, partial [Chloroflexota bacterium]|nr:VanW family protein [Chloroflexota bacterium]
ELDRAAVASYVAQLADEIYQLPEDGQLAWKDGLVVTKASIDGDQLRQDVTVTRLLVIAFTKARALSLPVQITKPQVPTDNLRALGIRGAIGEGSSKFTDSPPERVHNIHTAAGYLNGSVIPPGATFSFNEAIGPISPETGYKEGLTIVGDNTVAGVGGGVCQVSTTTFRAAFWSGLPIVERNQHSYDVPYYTRDGSPVGFDAAVYQPYVDLKFTNDTGKYILIQASWQGDVLRVVFYGTDPGRQVYRSKPQITNKVPPLPDKIVYDPALPPGKKEQVDWAHEGLDVRLGRTVTKNGKVLYKDTFFSHYKPWGNIYHVGPPAKKKANTSKPR